MQTLTLRPSVERGHVDFGWLKSAHSFSFGEYYDPAHQGYRALRVINDDTLFGDNGFPTHPHHDFEIITYMVKGALRHRDTMGNTALISAGEVQVMTTGTGVAHSEWNEADETRLLQIWLRPDRKGHTPRYDQKDFGKAQGLTLLVSGDGADGSLQIHQDAKLYRLTLDADKPVELPANANRGYWVQVVDGDLTVNDQTLTRGDGLALEKVEALKFITSTTAEVLIFDLA